MGMKHGFYALLPPLPNPLPPEEAFCTQLIIFFKPFGHWLYSNRTDRRVYSYWISFDSIPYIFPRKHIEAESVKFIPGEILRYPTSRFARQSMGQDIGQIGSVCVAVKICGYVRPLEIDWCFQAESAFPATITGSLRIRAYGKQRLSFYRGWEKPLLPGD